MKNVERILIIIILLLASQSVDCQAIGLHDYTAVPTWQWRCDSGDATLDFNPAWVIDSNRPIVFDSIPYADNYTLVVVYKPLVDSEASVWKLTFGDSSTRGLTTEHIVSDNTNIRYADTTTVTAVINTLRQSAPDSTSSTVRLTIGGDTLPGRVKVAEILYFNQRLTNSMLRRVQSALAIRYGITLGPVDYVDGSGRVIWSHSDSRQYHHRVTGIGRDSTYNVHQLRSRSEAEGALLTIRADSLQEGMFFVCGDDDASLEFVADESFEVLNRKWKIQGSGTEDNCFCLTFDRSVLSNVTDSTLLLVDGYPYFPDSVSSRTVVFRRVMFSSDTSTFTLAKRGACQQMTSNGGNWNDIRHNTMASESVIYPNPSSGRYTIEVTGVPWVKVGIYDIQGRLMESYSDSDNTQYIFKGELPTGNTYYATITTDSGTQTMKLVVK